MQRAVRWWMICRKISAAAGNFGGGFFGYCPCATVPRGVSGHGVSSGFLRWTIGLSAIKTFLFTKDFSAVAEQRTPTMVGLGSEGVLERMAFPQRKSFCRNRRFVCEFIGSVYQFFQFPFSALYADKGEEGADSPANGNRPPDCAGTDEMGLYVYSGYLLQG